MNINELEEQEKKLLADLRVVREAMNVEKMRIAKDEFGVFVGVVVVDGKGVEHRVTKVDVRWRGKPWVEGNQKKKDGTFGTAHRNLYERWQLA